jgi:hypothetical protein
MRTKIILIALFVIANSSSAKIEQGNSYSSQNGNVAEQMTLKTSRLGNSPNLASEPIEPAKKTDTPIKGEKKPRRHIFLKVVGGAVGAFFIFVAYYLRDWDISK